MFHAYPLARVDNAFATVVNPGALAARVSTEIVAVFADSENLRDGDWAVLLKRLGFGFGYERYGPIDSLPRVTRLTVGTGRQITRRVFVGSSLAWYFSKDDDLADLASLDIGFLARPVPRLSLAMVASGLNRPDFRGVAIERRYAAGVGVSPIRRLVLFVEDEIAADQNLAATVPAYGFELEPVRGIVLRAGADTDGDFRFGFEYNFAQSAYGVVGRYRHDGESDGRAGMIRLTDELISEPPRHRPGRER